MTKSKKLMTAALAVAALATASIATSWRRDARGGHGGGFRGQASTAAGSSSRRTPLRPPLARSPPPLPPGYGFAYNTCWKYTPYGLVNVCRVLPTKQRTTFRNTRPGEWPGRVFFGLSPLPRVPPGPSCAILRAPAGLRSRSAMAKPLRAPDNLLSVLPPESCGGAVCGRAPAPAQGRPDAVHRGRPGRRLLPGRAGPAQGERRVAVGRRAHPGDPRSRRAGRRVCDDRRAAALGVGDGGARFRIELHQPRLVRPGGRARTRTSIVISSRCWCGACATPIRWSRR